MSQTEEPAQVPTLAEQIAPYFERPPLWVRTLHRIGWWLSRLPVDFWLKLVVGFRVEGRIPDTGPAILAPSHGSFLDPPAMYLACGRPPRTLLTEKFYNKFPRFFRLMNTVPVLIEAGNRAALETSFEVLRRGEVLMIFPEGKVHPKARLIRGQPGVAMIASRDDTPVYPIAVVGSGKAMPRGRLIPRRGPVVIKIGKPIRWSDFDDVEAPAKVRRQMFTDAIMGSIAAMFGVEAPNSEQPEVPIYEPGAPLEHWPKVSGPGPAA